MQLQQFLTLSIALLILLAGWAEVWDAAPWWQALGLVPQMWWHVVPLALMVIPILLRVSRPVLALGMGLGLVLINLSIGMNLGVLLFLTDLMYSLGIRAQPRVVRTVGVGSASLVVLAVIAALLAGVDLASALSIGLILVGVLIVPLWWAGEVRRGYPLWQERSVRQQLEAERHAALLRSQAQQRRLLVEEERRRMAGELHDSVSSQVSAIALTSGAVLNTAADSARDRRALETIRLTSVEALDQLRDMVQLLRGEHHDHEPAAVGEPGDRDLAVSLPEYERLNPQLTWDNVITRAQDQGVEVTVSGTPPDDLPPKTVHVVLRLLQEALLNALKHGNATAEIHMDLRRRTLRLHVTSGLATGLSPQGAKPGTGTGLMAMRERITRHQGTLKAGPHDSDWIVEAELPVQEGDGD